MHWHKLENEQALDTLIEQSYQEPVFLFKHSNRCSISAVALQRLQTAWKLNDEQVKPYLIDVIGQRPISNKIAQEFEIIHESPQALLLMNGKCVYHASHMGISYREVEQLFTQK